MAPLVFTVALLLGAAAIIYIACEYFVNGIEWVGRRFAVGQKATGAILAAAGTALPESIVTFVAVAFGATAGAKEIGVGAAIGGPLVLSTLGYAVIGLALLATRQVIVVDAAAKREFRVLARDQGWFLGIFVVAVGLGLVGFPFKAWIGLGFLAAYAVYFWNTMRGGGADDEEGELGLEPLKIAPRNLEPSAFLALVQTSVALIVIVFASRLFVEQMQILGPRLGLPPQVLALLVSPIATELPEILNAVIWVRQGKINLALANISGSMMIQATIPSALGVIFTPWKLGPPLILAGGVIMLAVGVLYLMFRRARVAPRRLAAFGSLYLAFMVGLIVLRL